MADASSYEPVLSAKALAFLVGLSKPKQRRLIGLLFQLADNPNQIGDYSEPDDTGREIQFLLLREPIRVLELVISASRASRPQAGFRPISRRVLPGTNFKLKVEFRLTLEPLNELRLER